MKFFVFVFLATFAAAVRGGMISKEKMDAFLAIANACIAETGASQADLEAMFKNQAAINRETKCMRACVLKKFNMMNSDGKFDKEAALRLVAMHTGGDMEKMRIAKEVGDVCGDIPVPDDHCEAAEMYKMCLFEEARKHGIDVEKA